MKREHILSAVHLLGQGHLHNCAQPEEKNNKIKMYSMLRLIMKMTHVFGTDL